MSKEGGELLPSLVLPPPSSSLPGDGALGLGGVGGGGHSRDRRKEGEGGLKQVHLLLIKHTS